MKIKSVKFNNRRKAFEVKTANRSFQLPYSRATPNPAATDPITAVAVDTELGSEAFTYVLKSGREGSVHIEQVLDYNQDPGYLRDLLLYKLTLEVRKRVEASSLAKREIIRRLGTSATQFYRLLDQTNYRKSIDQLLSLLQILDCNVDLKVRTRGRRVASPQIGLRANRSQTRAHAPKRASRTKMADAESKPQRLSALGKYAGMVNSEGFRRRKQKDIAKEDRRLR